MSNQERQVERPNVEDWQDLTPEERKARAVAIWQRMVENAPRRGPAIDGGLVHDEQHPVPTGQPPEEAT